MPAAKYKGSYWNPERRDRRMVHPAKRKYFEIARMWERHHEIANFALLGMSNRQISEATGLCEATISHTLNSKVVKDKIAVMRAARDVDAIDLSKRILTFAPRCLSYLERLIEADGEDVVGASHTVRSKNARWMMEVAGFSPLRKSAVLTAHLTPDRIEQIKERARAKRVAAGVAT